jgi:hypothetical protein
MTDGGIMNIRPVFFSSLVLAAAGLAVAGGASALTCYSVLDRSDNLIYRDTYPPVDLSDQGASEREGMRRRGEHLLAMETDRCPTLEFFLGNAGSANLNIDQVIAGMPARSTLSASGVGATPESGAKGTYGSGVRRSGATSAGGATSKSAAPARPPAKSSGSSKY